MNREEKAVVRFFADEKIEYYASAPIENLPVVLPRLLPEGTRKAVVFLIPYYVKCVEPERNISSYAVSRDYHLYARLLSERLEKIFHEAGSQCFVKIMCDHSPLDEKKAAGILGLGVRGNNDLVINSKYGSDVFIAEILTDAELDVRRIDEAFAGKTGCMNCGKCKIACPTMLCGKGECMSALTQKKNPSEDELELLKSAKLKWGCDICRDVCPHNEGIPETPIEFFHKERKEVITSDLLDSMSEEEFKKRAFSWRGRKFAEKRFKD